MAEFKVYENKLLIGSNVMTVLLSAAALYFPKRWTWKSTLIGLLIGVKIIYVDITIVDLHMRKIARSDSYSLLAQ